MNLAKAKSKLAEASRSTGTKHAKILIADLCSVMKFLLDEVERLNEQSGSVYVGPGAINPIPSKSPVDVDPRIPSQPPWPDQPPNLPDRARTPPTRYTTSDPPPITTNQPPSLNAGDVE